MSLYRVLHIFIQYGETDYELTSTLIRTSNMYIMLYVMYTHLCSSYHGILL
jgi:hypothetical protein